MDFDLFLDILKIDSTSSCERGVADWLTQNMPRYGSLLHIYPEDSKPDEPINLFFTWGKPEIVLCTHLDTVPPYIPPTIENLPDGDTIILGRGSCDAKGQIFSMQQACKQLAEEGITDFGLLLLYGEETGSYGAKQFRNLPGGKVVIVGEPTDNKMVSASKGTKSFEVEISGTPCHSGYPSQGSSAIEKFVDIMEALRKTQWPVDPELGPTTYNVGKLISDNPQNILSPSLSCRIYFRTTFASDKFVCETMDAFNGKDVKVKNLGGDTPLHYLTLPGFTTTTVAFGSDAPQLTNFEQKILCGPGSILVAHRPEEFINLSDISTAIKQYVDMVKQLKASFF